MGFDAVTFLAQIVNLLVLIWLLKRFLYRPVLQIIEKRQQEISSAIKSANEKLANAANLESELTQKQLDFDTNRQKRLDSLEKEIALLEKEKLTELKTEISLKRQRLQSELENDLAKVDGTIRQFLAQQFLTLSHKVLAEWSDETPMDMAIKLFQKRILNLSKPQKNKILNFIKNQNVIDINSSSKLTKKQQETIIQILKQSWTIRPKTKINFHISSALVLGIEIRFQTMKLEWSIQSYLDDVEQRLGGILKNFAGSDK